MRVRLAWCSVQWLHAVCQLAVNVGATGTLDLSRDGRPVGPWRLTANLRSKILDFRGFDSSRILIIDYEGWISHVHREFPGKF